MKTYKNYLPKEFFNKLNTTVSSSNFPWYFSSRLLSYSKKESSDNFFMFHRLLDYGVENTITSNFFDMFYPLIYFLDKKHKVNNLMRMQINMYTNQNKKISHPPHIDFHDEPGEKTKGVKTGLFNFTTCNGGTNIDKKFYESKANEFHVFDNDTKHFGVIQTNTPIRIIINVNWR